MARKQVDVVVDETSALHKGIADGAATKRKPRRFKSCSWRRIPLSWLGMSASLRGRDLLRSRRKLRWPM